ncbi:MAG: Spy/CpxP family protein refolding chaperone [Comamonas sp.]|nr:Spy/CpxP family protein refolding chaperone [Comamonas sp.]
MPHNTLNTITKPALLPTKRLLRWVSICALSVASLGNLAAHAADPAASASNRPAHAGKHNPQTHEQRQAMQLERMKTLLQIQPKQEGIWQTYTQALQAIPQPEYRRPSADGKAAPATTLERLDWRKQQRQAHQTIAEQRDAATRQLYNSLQPSQQKAMDAMHSHAGKTKRRAMDHHKPRAWSMGAKPHAPAPTQQ